MADDRLPYGWTAGGLATLAVRAASSARYQIIDYDEARDIAAVAMVERLYQPGPQPGAADLFAAADRALVRERDAIWRDRGRNTKDRDQAARGYQRFWVNPPGDPFDERVCERIACWQVFWALDQRARDVLLARMNCATPGEAATWLGCSVPAYKNRLMRARREARILWAAPEPPAPLWGRDRPSAEGATRTRTIMQQRSRKVST
jgi:DNA-directed RNA polymerase specialized sigma24 family protein